MRKKRVRVNNIKFLAAVLVVVITVFAAVFISAKTVGNVAVSNVTDGFRRFFSSSEVHQFPYLVNSLGVKEIRRSGRDVFVLCDESCFVLSPSGKEAERISLPSADTRVSLCNGRALVYDIRKGTVMLLGQTEVLAETSVNGGIFTAAVGRNGCFAVAGPDEQAMSKVTVYGADQKVKFSWSCASERVTSIAFTKDCRRIAIACLGAENAAVYSRVVVFDLNSEEPAQDIRFVDTMVLGIAYSSKENLFVVGDNCYCVYNREFVKSAEENYAENSLSCYDIGENGAAIAVSEFGGSETSVVRFNAGGELMFKTTVEGEMENVAVDGKNTAVVSGSNAIVLNKAGEAGSRVSFDRAPDSSVFSSGSFYNLEENRIVKY